MKVTTSFHHIDNIPDVEARIAAKSKKMEKFMEGKTTIKWHCYTKNHGYCCEVDIIGPNFEFHAHGEGQDVYKALNIATDKLYRQLMKRKDKITNKLHRKGGELVCLDPEVAWIDHIDDVDSDDGHKKAA